MAQYLLNYLDGSTPQTADWSFRQGNGGHRLYAKAGSLSLESTSAGTKVAAFNPINGINDVEALVRFTLSSDRGKQGIVSLRYGGTAEANTTGYTLSGSIVGGKGHLSIDEGGTGNFSWTPWNYLPNVTYWARFRVNGSTMQAKVWTDGQPEPANWMLNATNTARPTGSYSGLHTYMTGTVRYSFISFGTNGDTAPRAVNNTTYKVGAKIAYPQAAPIDTPGLFWGGYGSVTAYGNGGYGTVAIPSYVEVESAYLANGRIEGAENTKYVSNATIQHIQSNRYSAGAIIERQILSSYKANATVQYQISTGYKASAALDINRAVEYIAGAELDSWHISGSSSYSVGARIEGKTELKYNTSAIVDEINSSRYTASGIIVDEKTTEYVSGATIVQESSIVYISSGYIGLTDDISYAAGACIEQIINLDYIASGFVSDRPGVWQETQNGTAQAWNENTNGIGQVWQETQNGTAQAWNENV